MSELYAAMTKFHILLIINRLKFIDVPIKIIKTK